MKLKKTLYGIRQSPCVFWQCLTKAMEAVGMQVSKLNPCLFVGDQVMVVAYVNDILFWATDEANINELG